MSQFDFGTINPDTKTGTDLASDLGSWRDALNSLHRGATRPAYAAGGMLWVREVSGTLWELNIFDGTNDVVIARINPSTGVFSLPNANVSQFTNDAGYALVGSGNTFTGEQVIDLGPAAGATALQLRYETTGTPNARNLFIATPADIAHPGGNPWQIRTPDAIDFLIDTIPALRLLENADVEITTSLNVLGPILQNGQPLDTGGAFEDELLHVRDEKASGTHGGTFTSAAWRTRDLNTVKANLISGALVGSNQVTLPAGTYWLEATAPGYSVNSHQLRWRNTSDNTTTLVGQSCDGASGAPSSQTHASVCGRFTIAGSKNFELQHRCDLTEGTVGFGAACGFGEVEVYSELKIWKVA